MRSAGDLQFANDERSPIKARAPVTACVRLAAIVVFLAWKALAHERRTAYGLVRALYFASGMLAGGLIGIAIEAAYGADLQCLYPVYVEGKEWRIVQRVPRGLKPPVSLDHCFPAPEAGPWDYTPGPALIVTWEQVLEDQRKEMWGQ